MNIKKLLRRTWKQIRGYLPLSMLMFLMIMIATPVLAAYNYVIPIQVANNSSTSYTNIPLLVTLDNDQLVTAGYITATGLDTDVQESAGIPFSVADDKLGIFLDTLAASQTLSLSDYLGFTPNATDYPLIVGVGGFITTGDDADIEIGTNFTVDLSGYIDTDDVSSNIVYKPGAFAIAINATGEIIAGAIDTETWTVGVENNYSAGAITNKQKVLQLETDRFVVLEQHTLGMYARVGVVNADDSITWGVASAQEGHDYGSIWDACAIDTSTFVIAHNDASDNDGWVAVGVIDPVTNAVTWSDSDEFLTTDAADISCCKVDTDKWAIVYEDVAGTEIETKVCTWSGAATTLGTAVVLDTDSSTALTGCCQLDTNKYVAIFETTDIEARACTVAGTVPTPGVLKTISTDNTSYSLAVQLDTDEFLAYWDDGSGINAEICTVSTTTITDSTQYTITTTVPTGSFVGTKVTDGELIFFIENSDADRKGESYSATYSGTVITPLDLANVFFTEGAEDAQFVSGCLLDEDTKKVLAVFSDASADDGFAEVGYVGSIGFGAVSVAETLVTAGNMQITVTGDTVDIKLWIDTIEVDTAVIGAGITDTAFDWVFMSSAIPYMDYLTIDKAGVQGLWYQPVTIIQTTAAVDRSGTGNHGVITWGSNPTGIEITASSAISTTDYFATTDGATITDPLPIPSGFNMTVTNTTGITDFWLYDLVNRAALHLGFSAQTMYVIIGLIAATGVGFGALIGTGNMLGFSIGFGATAGIFAATGVMPWWMIVIVVAVVGMGIYTWRRG